MKTQALSAGARARQAERLKRAASELEAHDAEIRKVLRSDGHAVQTTDTGWQVTFDREVMHVAK